MKGLFEHATVCTKTLCRYIDLGLLPLKNIDLPMKVSRKPKIARVRQYKKVFGQSIGQRAASVQTREEFGHWEIDTVLGSRTQGAVLLTLTERKTRKEHILKIPRKQAICVQQAMQKLKQLYGSAFSNVFKSITSGNGSEFCSLCDAVDGQQLEVYYMHHYTSCERGTNERHNGLIRRFIPRGKSMDEISDTMIAYIENWCNTLPRKIWAINHPTMPMLKH